MRHRQKIFSDRFSLHSRARANSWTSQKRSFLRVGVGGRLPLIVLALVLILQAFVGTAGAFSGWSIQPTPNASTPGVLSSVECPSPTACTAVGNYTNSSGVVVTLAEEWNGTSWAIETTSNPSRATDSTLSGVSCTSATSCTAVGWYINSSGVFVTLAEASNGASWAIQTTPNPAGATQSYLKDVSCTSATACTAVGDYHNSSGAVVTLAERWNGTSWTIQTTPNPSGATNSSLNGVSCTSSAACIAAGNDNSGKGVTLAERWNGASWAIQPTPNPAGATSSTLRGLSCTSTNACTAVGNYHNSSRVYVTLAEHWNGTSWAIQTTPNPSGATSSTLSGVSCTSTTACAAAGNYTNSSGVRVTLAEHWNGTSWAIETTPNPSGATSSTLSGVSCTSTTACAAAGNYTNSSGVQVTLEERWNGTSWAIETTPNPSDGTNSVLNDVSCTSTTACTAVGYISGSNGLGTFAEEWNGTSWAIETTRNPSGVTSITLSGVSCTSATSCTAVGWYVNSSGVFVTLAEAWNGASWAIQTTPNPAGATQSYLNDVSCTSATACTAVGEYHNSSGAVVTLAERWNGTSWTIQTTPNPSGATNSSLNSVSCSSSAACIAVGDYTNSSYVKVTLAEHWNGTSWAIQTTPNPSGAIYSVLSGVSCTSTTACTAVGLYFTSSSPILAFAEHWNGTSWTFETTPNPAGATESYLNDVSCTSASACTAVGDYTNSSAVQVTLAERWNGTSWAIQTTPSATSSALNGVSCISVSACTAVGDDYTNNSGPEVTLAEHEG